MEKKEFYRHILPHFQQPGQAYFVTWNLKDAIPPKALVRYTQKLNLLKSQILNLGAANSDSPKNRRDSSSPLEKYRDSEIAAPFELLKKEYDSVRKKYIKAYDDLLDAARHPAIDLSQPENREIIGQTLQFWEGKKLKSKAYTIMPNHVHWVFELLYKDIEGNPVYLQDIMQSVKRHSANQINKAENRAGPLWQKESFDTTIRDEQHLYNAVK